MARMVILVVSDISCDNGDSRHRDGDVTRNEKPEKSLSSLSRPHLTPHCDAQAPGTSIIMIIIITFSGLSL